MASISTLAASVGQRVGQFRRFLTWLNLTTQRKIQRNLDFVKLDNL